MPVCHLMKRIVFILLSLCSIASCDPVKNVLISNQTDKDVKVVIVQNATRQFSLGSGQQTQIELKKSGELANKRFSYGLGKFSKGELNLFNSSIQQIIIVSKNDSCVVEGDGLKDFLPKKRIGVYNSTIELKILNCPPSK